MKNKNKLLIILLLIFTSFSFIGCQDRQAESNEFTVMFYTGLDTTNVTPTRIDPIIEVQPGDHVVKPEDPTVSGATFLGWYKEKECINAWNFENDVVVGSTVLYSKWDPHTLSVTYVFDEAGGTFLDDKVETFTVLNTQILPKADRLGSLFLGWILTPIDQYKVGDRIVKTTSSFSSDVTVYALFENKEYTIRFRSMLEGVTNPKTYVVEYASEIDFPVLADTATKTFVGWFSNDGTTTGDWGFQYINGEIYLGKALSYNAETSEWEFLAQGITVFAKWDDK